MYNGCTYATNVHILKLAVQTSTAFILEHEIPCTVQQGSSHISVNIPTLIIPFLCHITVNIPILFIPFLSLTSQSTVPFWSYHFPLLLSRQFSHLGQNSHFYHTISLFFCPDTPKSEDSNKNKIVTEGKYVSYQPSCLLACMLSCETPLCTEWPCQLCVGMVWYCCRLLLVWRLVGS